MTNNHNDKQKTLIVIVCSGMLMALMAYVIDAADRRMHNAATIDTMSFCKPNVGEIAELRWSADGVLMCDVIIDLGRLP